MSILKKLMLLFGLFAPIATATPPQYIKNNFSNIFTNTTFETWKSLADLDDEAIANLQIRKDMFEFAELKLVTSQSDRNLFNRRMTKRILALTIGSAASAFFPGLVEVGETVFFIAEKTGLAVITSLATLWTIEYTSSEDALPLGRMLQSEKVRMIYKKVVKEDSLLDKNTRIRVSQRIALREFAKIMSKHWDNPEFASIELENIVLNFGL